MALLIAAITIFAALNPLPVFAQTTTAPVGQGQQLASFEVVSIKPDSPAADGQSFPQLEFRIPGPGRFHANASVVFLIYFAYDLEPAQLPTQDPPWLRSQFYVVDAKTSDSAAAELEKLTRSEALDQTKQMVRALLADRFKLKLSTKTKERPILALVVAKGGLKLTPTSHQAPFENGSIAGKISAVDEPISGLAELLSNIPGMGPVENRTGIAGRYDFELHFAPQTAAPGAPPLAGDSTNSSEPPIFTALRQQLGLKLESIRGPMLVYGIEHVEQPAPN